MKLTFHARVLPLAASAFCAASAFARDITSFKISATGETSHAFAAEIEAGRTGDGHVAYFAWSESGDAGLTLAWMDGETDIYGTGRVCGSAVDIGCAELEQTGFSVIVR